MWISNGLAVHVDPPRDSQYICTSTKVAVHECPIWSCNARGSPQKKICPQPLHSSTTSAFSTTLARPKPSTSQDFTPQAPLIMSREPKRNPSPVPVSNTSTNHLQSQEHFSKTSETSRNYKIASYRSSLQTCPQRPHRNFPPHLAFPVLHFRSLQPGLR